MSSVSVSFRCSRARCLSTSEFGRRYSSACHVVCQLISLSPVIALMLFENVAAQQPFACNTEAFYNPQITKVEVTIEGIPNKLYSQGMRAYQMWEEAKKHFAQHSKRHPDVGTVAKDLALADVNLGEFLTSKYSLWLDLRTSDDDCLHGSMPAKTLRSRSRRRQRRPAL